MADTIIHHANGTRLVIKMALLCSVTILVTLIMAACHPYGITVNFANPGPYNYTSLTFDSQPVNGGNIDANTSYSLTGVKNGVYSIFGTYGTAGYICLVVYVYGIDNEDTWNGPGSGGGNGSWSSR